MGTSPQTARHDRRVVVAMSGGVDSSVAAWMLQQAGYQCIGVFLRIGLAGGGSGPDAAAPGGRRLRHGCCSVADAIDARMVAARLGIPFYALNFEGDFGQIVDYFVDEYAAGRTPNPCICCNTRIKFGRLLEYADALGARYVATGHYARVVREDGTVRLARSLNRTKDQSYVLFGVRREQLDRFLLPLGEVSDKQQVRERAKALGLRVHDKPDSQEICFVPDNDYRGLIARRRPEALRPGPIVDTSGRVLGEHAGLAGYTVGQRRGLRVAAGRPLYVVQLRLHDNTLVVGTRDEACAQGLIADDVNWLIDPPSGPMRASVQIRYRHAAAPATLEPHLDQAVRVRFDEPQLAVTPGQAAVFYDGDVVLGGGWIRETVAADSR